MSPDEAQAVRESWNILSGFGVLGLIGAIFLLPLAALLWWGALAVRRHGEGLAAKAKVVLDNAIAQQPLVLTSLTDNTRATKELAEAVAKAKDHTAGMLSGLQPTEDHPFSKVRTEEAMLLGCDIIDAWNHKETDDEVRHVISTLTVRMRTVLQRKIGSRA